jgi:hypothetical protein
LIDTVPGALHLAEEPEQPRAAVGLGVTVGGEDADRRLGDTPQEVPEQVQRGFGSPVDVVDDEQHGLIGGGGLEPTQHGVEQPVLLGARVGLDHARQVADAMLEVGNEAAEFAGESAEIVPRPACGARRSAPGVGERLERRSDSFVAPTVEHERTVVDRLDRQLTRQPGLADPGLPGDEDPGDLAGADTGPRATRLDEFAFAAHEANRPPAPSSGGSVRSGSGGSASQVTTQAGIGSVNPFASTATRVSNLPSLRLPTSERANSVHNMPDSVAALSRRAASTTVVPW